MNIDELRIGEAKQIARLLNTGSAPADNTKKHPFLGRYVIVRTYSAGVHVGVLSGVFNSKVILTGARRIHSWRQKFTLSSVAVNGVSEANMSVAVKEIIIDDIEIIPCTEIARKSLEEKDSHGQ